MVNPELIMKNTPVPGNLQFSGGTLFANFFLISTSLITSPLILLAINNSFKRLKREPCVSCDFRALPLVYYTNNRSGTVLEEEIFGTYQS
ncbi:unnamed protein product [Calicophoron daubneyi]|uniref:Uncharacterized protein n=1 Tax=Calicophoron daubneyi TaxID=300641 RepID=A0AAV2SYH1_CALDB